MSIGLLLGFFLFANYWQAGASEIPTFFLRPDSATFVPAVIFALAEKGEKSVRRGEN